MAYNEQTQKIKVPQKKLVHLQSIVIFRFSQKKQGVALRTFGLDFKETRSTKTTLLFRLPQKEHTFYLKTQKQNKVAVPVASHSFQKRCTKQEVKKRTLLVGRLLCTFPRKCSPYKLKKR